MKTAFLALRIAAVVGLVTLAVAPPARGAAPRLDERTAYLIGAGRLKLGLLAFEYGLAEWISVGTSPPAWATRALLPLWVPNLHVKLKAFERGPLALALQGAVYYASLSDDRTTGRLLSAPLSLLASVRLASRLWLHAEGTYLFARAVGGTDYRGAALTGAAGARAGQAGAMLELRMTPRFALTAIGRYQFDSGPLVFDGAGTIDEYTSIQVGGQLTPRIGHPSQAIAGVAFLWRHVRLTLGAGYGNYFVPGLGFAVPARGFVPDASLSAVL